MPYGMRYPNGGQDFDLLGQNTVDLRALIQAKHGVENTAIQGTDANPLVLSFTMSSGIQAASGMGYNTGYMELALQENTVGPPEDESIAPMDFVLVGMENPSLGNCFECYWLCHETGYPESGTRMGWQTVCQSYTARTAEPACPPAKEQIWNVLAVGANSYLDNDPCHCATTADQVPNNWHLSLFDGYKWMILTSSNVPGYTGTFSYADKLDTVVMTIKTDTIDVYHKAKFSGASGGATVESYRTGIPRQYQGPFNRLRGGTATACELRDDEYRCQVVGGPAEGGIEKCIKTGEPKCTGAGPQFNKAGNLIFDNVYLKDGTAGGAIEGACCLTTGDCVPALAQDCDAMGGAFSGEGSTCEATLCCPTPFADADGDNDVDADDFGALQACFTGEGPATVTGDCRCFDREPDDDVDGDDYGAFDACSSGADVPVDPGCGG
jgi:hypothetical protein